MADATDDLINGESTEGLSPRIERGFETSRLSDEFLVLAYEAVVPVCIRTNGLSTQDRREDMASHQNDAYPM